MESLENQDIQESIQDAIPLEKVKKTTKPRSEKQMENFKKLQEKRKEAIEKKKLEKKIEASKLLLEQEQLNPVDKPRSVPPLGTKPPQVIQKKKTQELSPPPSDDEDNSSVEKIIVNVKKKPKKAKKAKEIIIYNDDDSDTEEEERPSGTSRYSDVEEYHPPKRTFGKPELVAEQRSLKTQQNKKSKTKVYQQEQPQIFKSQSMNYFVD